jgi:hypothetical protein
MLRLSLALTLSCLAACTDTLDERLAELDERVEVDCGFLGDCVEASKADAAVECLRSNLAAGIGAKVYIELGVDPVLYIYAVDGAYVSLEGYVDIDTGPDFEESVCRDVQSIDMRTCSAVRSADCEKVRHWTD